MLTDAEILELQASREAARLNRKAVNRRRYERRYARIRAKLQRGASSARIVLWMGSVMAWLIGLPLVMLGDTVGVAFCAVAGLTTVLLLASNGSES